jgi:hypothetical protein
MSELVQRLIDDFLAEAAGWEAKGNFYWAQGQWSRAIEAFERRVGCLICAQRMRSHRGHRRKT